MHIVNKIEEPYIDNAVVIFMQGKPEQPQSVSTTIPVKILIACGEDS
ncbi:MAG: glutaredoxin-related protein [Gammaproteobacteria bacterium]|jgi:glutaredoxin-related protein